MEQQSHLFDEIKASTRLQMAKEIIEGIQALNIGTYLEAQTINRAIEVVKGTTGISQQFFLSIDKGSSQEGIGCTP